MATHQLTPRRSMLGAVVPKQQAAKPTVLSSKWTGLSPHLLATIFPVTPDGQRMPGPEVVSPPTDGTFEATANWNSPFENSGTETKAPAIMAMLQIGGLQSLSQPLSKIAAGLQSSGSFVQKLLGDALQGFAGTVGDFAAQAQGRSGMTKLNSTQIFSGSPPLRLPMTLHFRAFSNPAAEVRAPVDQLWAWFLARKLAADGVVTNAVKGNDVVSRLLPSEAPQMVGFRFGGFTFAPMVIETLSHPITVPRAFNGEALHVAVNITLATLTALDAGDWRRARDGKPTLLFNN